MGAHTAGAAAVPHGPIIIYILIMTVGCDDGIVHIIPRISRIYFGQSHTYHSCPFRSGSTDLRTYGAVSCTASAPREIGGGRANGMTNGMWHLMCGCWCRPIPFPLSLLAGNLTGVRLLAPAGVSSGRRLGRRAPGASGRARPARPPRSARRCGCASCRASPPRRRCWAGGRRGRRGPRPAPRGRPAGRAWSWRPGRSRRSATRRRCRCADGALHGNPGMCARMFNVQIGDAMQIVEVPTSNLLHGERACSLLCGWMRPHAHLSVCFRYCRFVLVLGCWLVPNILPLCCFSRR